MSNDLGSIEEIRHRSRADRPSPAIPLLFLALVVAGALVVALIRAGQVTVVVNPAQPEFSIVNRPVPAHDRVRLTYWIFASIVAYGLALWMARRQGYRRGVWVDRRPLVVAGLIALLVAVAVALMWFLPYALVGRGNVPLLAIAVGIVVWAVRERRPGLWILAAVIVSLALLANLYDMESVLFRFGVPNFDNADEVANLGTVAVLLFAASGIFGVLHRREARAVGTRGAP
jgi:hypothetical protein